VVRDVAWFGTDGQELPDEVWNAAWSKSLAVMFNGRTLNTIDDEGQKVVDDSFLFIVNAAEEGVEYILPEPPNKSQWRQVLDTENIDDPFSEAEVHDKVIVGGRSVRVYSDSTEPVAKSPSKQKPSKTL